MESFEIIDLKVINDRIKIVFW